MEADGADGRYGVEQQYTRYQRISEGWILSQNKRQGLAR